MPYHMCAGATAAATLAATLSLAGCAAMPKEPMLTPEQRALNVESFERAWARVHDQYWDPDFGGLDWQAVHDELRPKVAEATTMSAARDAMVDMVRRLGASHFGFFPREVFEETEESAGEAIGYGVTGIDLRVIDGHALVTGVVPESPAWAAGVRPGWEVVRVGDTDIVALLARLEERLEDTSRKPLQLTYSVVPRLMGEIGERVSATFLDGDDEEIELEISLAEERGGVASLGHLKGLRTWIDVNKVDEDIGYIAFNAFFDPPRVMKAFNDAMTDFMNADGIVIDLRGNAGGLGAMAMGMAGWLVAERDVTLGTMYTRGNELRMVVQPRPKAYAGPVAMLVDGLSGSASEFLSGGLQANGRVCVVGSRTKGEVLPAQFEKLPNGDVFLFATANFVSAGGQRFEGVGVEPDIEVSPSRADLLAGRDAALEAAIAWIRDQR